LVGDRFGASNSLTPAIAGGVSRWPLSPSGARAVIVLKPHFTRISCHRFFCGRDSARALGPDAAQLALRASGRQNLIEITMRPSRSRVSHSSLLAGTADSIIARPHALNPERTSALR
jgi:hypothetical protein